MCKPYQYIEIITKQSLYLLYYALNKYLFFLQLNYTNIGKLLLLFFHNSLTIIYSNKSISNTSRFILIYYSTLLDSVNVLTAMKTGCELSTSFHSNSTKHKYKAIQIGLYLLNLEFKNIQTASCHLIISLETYILTITCICNFEACLALYYYRCIPVSILQYFNSLIKYCPRFFPQISDSIAKIITLSITVGSGRPEYSLGLTVFRHG